MLVPTSVNPVSRDGWAVVIDYEEDGFVADADADRIEYGELLKEMSRDPGRQRGAQEAGVRAGDPGRVGRTAAVVRQGAQKITG